MDEPRLYRLIVEAVRKDLLSGNLKPGDRLPSVREMAERWSCTVGTVQHAYQDLVRQGLVTSRAGQGTRVVDDPPLQGEAPLRRAMLIHRAEAFLLEVLTGGYSLADVERAFHLATDRWRTVEHEVISSDTETLHFVGSHDLVLSWLSGHFPEVMPGYELELQFTGSLGGLIALAEGRADLAGSHLWDDESDTYNLPFVRRLLPGKRTALVTLAHRRIGLIVPDGNPRKITGLEDLLQPGLRFVNRQAGSGTRVWLDVALRRAGLSSTAIQGYNDEKMTHSAVAQAIAEKQADTGLGLEAAAISYGLDFVLLTHDRYDLVIPEAMMETEPIRALIEWLRDPQVHKQIEKLGGYDSHASGEISWVEP